MAQLHQPGAIVHPGTNRHPTFPYPGVPTGCFFRVDIFSYSKVKLFKINHTTPVLIPFENPLAVCFKFSGAEHHLWDQREQNPATYCKEGAPMATGKQHQAARGFSRSFKVVQELPHIFPFMAFLGSILWQSTWAFVFWFKDP